MCHDHSYHIGVATAGLSLNDSSSVALKGRKEPNEKKTRYYHIRAHQHALMHSSVRAQRAGKTTLSLMDVDVTTVTKAAFIPV